MARALLEYPQPAARRPRSKLRCFRSPQAAGLKDYFSASFQVNTLLAGTSELWAVGGAVPCLNGFRLKTNPCGTFSPPPALRPLRQACMVASARLIPRPCQPRCLYLRGAPLPPSPTAADCTARSRSRSRSRAPADAAVAQLYASLQLSEAQVLGDPQLARQLLQYNTLPYVRRSGYWPTFGNGFKKQKTLVPGMMLRLSTTRGGRLAVGGFANLASVVRGKGRGWLVAHPQGGGTRRGPPVGIAYTLLACPMPTARLRRPAAAQARLVRLGVRPQRDAHHQRGAHPHRGQPLTAFKLYPAPPGLPAPTPSTTTCFLCCCDFSPNSTALHSLPAW